tara:strand:+ start:1312 stop:1494 length:183 start_codon:yes stop_codon:yes gene_type:complete
MQNLISNGLIRTDFISPLFQEYLGIAIIVRLTPFRTSLYMQDHTVVNDKVPQALLLHPKA